MLFSIVSLNFCIVSPCLFIRIYLMIIIEIANDMYCVNIVEI